MDSIKLIIKAGEEEQELLIATLSDFNVSGFEQLDDELVAWFSANEFDEEKIKPALKSFPYKAERVIEQNWNELWEKDFQPVIVEDFCAIRAHFHQPVHSVQHEIIITPKMSFGTGHHATTYMMIQQMKNIEFRNKTVFDFGTGTGILAILAEKLGAKAVTAIDIDEWSINNAIENLERNNCNLTDVYQSADVPDDKAFDIILANINKNVILQHLPVLCSALSAEGIIVLSGLLQEDENEMIAACKALPLKLLRNICSSNWISLYFSKLS